MKEKHLKILAAVFLGLLVIFFVTKPRHRSVNIEELVQNVIIGVAADDVGQIEVYRETGGKDPARMVLNKTESGWRLPTYFNAKGQKTQIERLIKDAIDMTGTVRSTDPKHHDTYAITDAKGIHFLLKDESGKVMANLIIGKKPDDQGSSFVRFSGNDKVYFTDKDLLSDLGVYGDIDTVSHFNARRFADLHAVDQKKEDLEMIALVSGAKRIILKQVEREEDAAKNDSTAAGQKKKVWVLAQGKKESDLDTKAVDSFLRDVTSIYASEVVDGIGNSLADLNKPARYGTDKPGHYIVFKKPDRPQENVIFGKEYEKDAGYFLEVQSDGLVYKVSKANFDRIFKWIDDLPKKIVKG